MFVNWTTHNNSPFQDQQSFQFIDLVNAAVLGQKHNLSFAVGLILKRSCFNVYSEQFWIFFTLVFKYKVHSV